MFSLESVSSRFQLINKTFLTFAVLGLAIPSASLAQPVSKVSANSNTYPSSATHTVLADGIYLFGQSPNPNQIGAAYAIFSVQANQTVGAFYQPQSSFDCFTGEAYPNQLAVNVIDSYNQTIYPYNIALTVEDTLVAGNAAGAYTLDGFHRIEDISANDEWMLSTCQANIAQ